MRRGGRLAGVGVAAVSVALVGASQGARAAGTPIAFGTVNVGAYGGEPSIISDSKGVLYYTTPSGGTITYKSTDHGLSWSQVATADPSSGDDCLGVDQSDAVYLCNLAGSQSMAPLQADEWKSTNQGSTWAHGAGTLPVCGTSCSPFGVDRDWTDAAILPPNTTTGKAEVALMYHDFYGPSQIWVNLSTDGGATFGAPIEVLASPAVTPGAVTGTLEAQGYTFCNTVPAGVGIVRPGLPHAGRIYVGWIAADLPQNATGCNVSMLQAFHTIWISWSDDGGATWTPQQVFDAGIGHDTSTPFVSFTLDDQGNPYFGFAAQGPSDDPVTCAAESTAGTVQSDSSCQDNMYVVWSHDGGQNWDGGGGLIGGSAGTAYEASPPSEVGTHFFPAIAAGDPGQVSVAYLDTNEILPTDLLGKADPGGCAGPGPANGNPTTYPPTCSWNLMAAQSLDLTAAPGSETWTHTAVTSTPMHVGDICNLGIFCVDPNSNRNLLDFIQDTIDPTTGCAHISFPDDNTINKLREANQTSGCLPLAALATQASPAPTPTASPAAASAATPNTSAPSAGGAAVPALAALAVLGGGASWATRRRRRRAR